MRLLIDENVQDRVASVFVAAGHEVMLVRELGTFGIPDQLIAAIADDDGLIVVIHDKGFRRLITQVPPGARTRFRETAGRISLSGVREPAAAERVEALMVEIEFAHARALAKGQRLIMAISSTTYYVVSS